MRVGTGLSPAPSRPSSRARLLNLAAVPAANLIPRKELKSFTHLLYRVLDNSSAGAISLPEHFSRTVIMPVNSNQYIGLRYFEEIMTEGSLAAI
jgi:hypothetical protein